MCVCFWLPFERALPTRFFCLPALQLMMSLASCVRQLAELNSNTTADEMSRVESMALLEDLQLEEAANLLLRCKLIDIESEIALQPMRALWDALDAASAFAQQISAANVQPLPPVDHSSWSNSSRYGYLHGQLETSRQCPRICWDHFSYATEVSAIEGHVSGIFSMYPNGYVGVATWESRGLAASLNHSCFLLSASNESSTSSTAMAPLLAPLAPLAPEHPC